METYRPNNSFIEKKLFTQNFLIEFIAQISNLGARFVDRLIVSICFGAASIAAMELIGPFFSLIGIISGMMAIGTGKICVGLLCKGDKENAQGVYSCAVFLGLLLSVLITVLCIVFSDPIIGFLGVTDPSTRLFTEAKYYLTGIAFITPSFVLRPVLTPILQMSGKKMRINLSLAAVTVFSILFDILSAVYGLGVSGVALGGSAAQLIGLLILIFPSRKPPILKPRLGSIRAVHLKHIFKEGMPKIVRRTCNIIRPVTVNRVLLLFAGSTGMAAMSVRNSLSGFAECIGTALGAVVLMLAVMYATEENECALKRLVRRAMKYVFTAVLVAAVLLFVFSPKLAALYIRDDLLARSYASEAIKFMAVDLVMLAIIEILAGYWQGTRYTGELNVIVVFQRLIFPLLSVFICGQLFGIRGLWASFPISSLLTILSFGIMNYIKRKSLSLFPVPENCRIPKPNRLEYIVTSLDGIDVKIEHLQRFCENAGVDPKLAMFIAFSFEEAAVINMEHGLVKKKKEKCFDFFIAVTDGHITLRFRDNCCGYKDIDYCDVFASNPIHLKNHVGAKLVMDKAKKIDYVSMFGTNSLIIEF